MKGVPNKNKPLKTFLRSHSLDYFTPGDDGLSAYDRDILKLDPKERVNAELALLKYHTAQMQATAVDVSVADEKVTFAQRLANLANDND